MVFVDLETTGATATADRITEIGIVEVNEEGRFAVVEPGQPAGPDSGFIQGPTGITDDMVASAPTFAEIG